MGEVVVTRGDPRCPEVVEVLKRKGADLTSSYGEEKTAMQLGLKWVEENCSESTTVVIATDSQSLCQALSGNDQKTKRLRGQILDLPSNLMVQ